MAVLESSAEGILSAVCASLNLSSVQGPLNSLLRFVRTLSSKMLLILDGTDDSVLPDCVKLVECSKFMHIVLLRDDEPGDEPLTHHSVGDLVVLRGLDQAAAEALVMQLNPELADVRKR